MIKLMGCNEIKDVKDRTNMANTIHIKTINIVTINSHNKRVRDKMDHYLLLTCLSMTVLLFKIALITQYINQNKKNISSHNIKLEKNNGFKRVDIKNLNIKT